MIVLALGAFAAPARAKPTSNEACRVATSFTAKLVALADPGPAAEYARAAKLFRTMTGQKPAILKEAHKIGRRMTNAKSVLGKNTALERASNFCKY